MKTILGSQSPQRSALLQTVISGELLIVPPSSDDEPTFDGLDTIESIETQLRRVVDLKFTNVQQQVFAGEHADQDFCLICADTVVVAKSNDGMPIVLGKPPSGDWKPTVRDWFGRYYAGAEHQVWSGFRVGTRNHNHQEIVKTSLTLREIDAQLLEWYLSTNEPVGKAGGYGVQGIAAMFVESIHGSLTNVVGLPMLELTKALRKMGVITLSKS